MGLNLFAAAKRLAASVSAGSSSQINPQNQNKVATGKQTQARGSKSDDPGRRAGYGRTLSQQDISRLAAELEERGRRGVNRYINPKNRSKKQGSAFAIANEGTQSFEVYAQEKKPLSREEAVAQHDELWRYNRSMRDLVGVKVFGY